MHNEETRQSDLRTRANAAYRKIILHESAERYGETMQRQRERWHAERMGDANDYAQRQLAEAVADPEKGVYFFLPQTGEYQLGHLDPKVVFPGGHSSNYYRHQSNPELGWSHHIPETLRKQIPIEHRATLVYPKELSLMQAIAPYIQYLQDPNQDAFRTNALNAARERYFWAYYRAEMPHATKVLEANRYAERRLAELLPESSENLYLPDVNTGVYHLGTTAPDGISPEKCSSNHYRHNTNPELGWSYHIPEVLRKNIPIRHRTTLFYPLGLSIAQAVAPYIQHLRQLSDAQFRLNLFKKPREQHVSNYCQGQLSEAVRVQEANRYADHRLVEDGTHLCLLDVASGIYHLGTTSPDVVFPGKYSSNYYKNPAQPETGWSYYIPKALRKQISHRTILYYPLGLSIAQAVAPYIQHLATGVNPVQLNSFKYQREIYFWESYKNQLPEETKLREALKYAERQLKSALPISQENLYFMDGIYQLSSSAPSNFPDKHSANLYKNPENPETSWFYHIPKALRRYIPIEDRTTLIYPSSLSLAEALAPYIQSLSSPTQGEVPSEDLNIIRESFFWEHYSGQLPLLKTEAIQQFHDYHSDKLPSLDFEGVFLGIPNVPASYPEHPQFFNWLKNSIIEVRVSYENELREAERRARRHRGFKSFVGIACGVGLSCMFGPQMMICVGKAGAIAAGGALSGGLGSALGGGNPLKGALQGALFSGFGAGVNQAMGAAVQGLHCSTALKAGIQGAGAAAATSTVSTAINGGHLDKNLFIGVTVSGLSSALTSGGAFPQTTVLTAVGNTTLKSLVTGTVTSMVTHTPLGENLMVSDLGGVLNSMAANCCQINSSLNNTPTSDNSVETVSPHSNTEPVVPKKALLWKAPHLEKQHHTPKFHNEHPAVVNKSAKNLEPASTFLGTLAHVTKKPLPKFANVAEGILNHPGKTKTENLVCGTLAGSVKTALKTTASTFLKKPIGSESVKDAVVDPQVDKLVDPFVDKLVAPVVKATHEACHSAFLWANK